MDAEGRTIETDREPTADRAPRPSRRALWLFLAVALVPLVGAAVRLAHAGWLPEGDDAMIARRSMSVLSTKPPLTGQPSTSGNLFIRTGGRTKAATIDASHPGPFEYYALALPYRLGGWTPGALLVAVLLITGASAAATVWLAWRRLGPPGAAAAAVAVLVVAERLGSWNLARPLGASVLVLPLLAGMVAAWSVLDGDQAGLAPAIVALSFVIQTHLGSAPLGALLLVAAVVAGARHAWQERSWRPPAVALGLLVLVWLPPLIDQASGHPGNMTRLVEVMGLHPDRAGPGFGFRAVAWFTSHPAWPGMDPIGRIAIIGPIPAGRAVLGGVAVLLVLAGCGGWAWRRGHRSLRRLAVIAPASLLVSALLLSTGPDEVRLGPAYLLTGLVAGQALVALLVVATLLDAARPVLSGRLVPVAAVLLGVVGLVSTVAGGPTYRADEARTADLSSAIRHHLAKGTYLLSASGNYAYLSTLDAVSVNLLRHGYDIRLVRLGALPDEPQRRDTDVDVPTIVVSTSGDVPDDATELARLGPSTDSISWAGGLDRALRRPDVQVTVVDGLPQGTAPCLDPVRQALRRPGHPVAVAHAILDCPQATRRLVMAHVRFTGLDRFWVDLLGSSMIAPYPPTPLVAYVVPARR